MLPVNLVCLAAGGARGSRADRSPTLRRSIGYRRGRAVGRDMPVGPAVAEWSLLRAVRADRSCWSCALLHGDGDVHRVRDGLLRPGGAPAAVSGCGSGPRHRRRADVRAAERTGREDVRLPRDGAAGSCETDAGLCCRRSSWRRRSSGCSTSGTRRRPTRGAGLRVRVLRVGVGSGIIAWRAAPAACRSSSRTRARELPDDRFAVAGRPLLLANGKHDAIP